MDLKERYEGDMLRKLYSSVSEEVKRLMDDNKRLLSEVFILEAQKKQWGEEKAKQQSMIQSVLNAANSKNNGYLEELVSLREENARLRKKLDDGNHN